MLTFHDSMLPIEWRNGEIDDSTTWHEFLRLFVGVKELRIKTGLLKELARALHVG
jgi:hypothetical protein